MNIIQTPSPNFNERPLGIDTIIIHYTDMISSEAALAWLINPSHAHYPQNGRNSANILAQK
jgi:hypothetical protein